MVNPVDKSTQEYQGVPPLPAKPNRLGHYELLDHIGKGGMGDVYRAMHTRLKKIVALKVLPEHRFRDKQAIARFCREMEAIGRLDHPHLVRATDAGEENGQHYLVMEFLVGEDLNKLVKRVGPLSLADACELTRQAALGLSYIHEHGMVHRDIKPSNLLLTAAGQVKILDWGLAKVSSEGLEELTMTGQAMGTPDYMAPEQWADSSAVDIRADIYGLGCTLFKLLTGHAPFSRHEKPLPESRTPARDSSAGTLLQQRRPDLPATLCDLVERMTAQQSTDRPQSPREIADDLAEFCQGAELGKLVQPPASTQDPHVTRDDTNQGQNATETSHKPANPARRLSRPMRFAAATLLVLFIGSGSAFLWWQSQPYPTIDDTANPSAELEPGKWHNLMLVGTPKAVVWATSVRDASRWDLDKQKEELFCNCEDIGLLSLADVQAEEYSVSIALRQNPWTGRTGIFFGCQPKVHKGRNGMQYQTVELRPFRKDKVEQAFAMWRSVVFRWVDERGEPQFESLADATQSLPWPSHREQVLEIAISKRGVTQVRWDGKELSYLTRPEFNAKLGPDDQKGTMGIYLHLGTCTFRNARLFIERSES